MNDVRRRLIRLSVLVLPALLLIAAVYVVRADFRDASSALMAPRYKFDNGRLTFLMKGKARTEALAVWTRDVISNLVKSRDFRTYGFKEPKGGFLIEVRSEPGSTGCEQGSNRIVISGIPDDAPWESVQHDLSRLIARTMLREGAPDADFSPWFEEGVSRYYETTQNPVSSIGSRKDDLITLAARNPPLSLDEALSARRGAYFEAVSHSIVAFLHQAFGSDKISQYAEIERAPGSVPLGEFQRIFGDDVERRWREFLENRPRGS